MNGINHAMRPLELWKTFLVKTPMSKLFHFGKDFEIHSNASIFAIGRILVQDGRLVAFESIKLNEIQRRWQIHENEMWVVIHYFKIWGHYIGSKDVVVWTNNVTLKCFATQPKLPSKQVRWQDTLALFNVDIQHKPGKDNVDAPPSSLLDSKWVQDVKQRNCLGVRGTLLALSTRRGRGACWGSGIRLGRGTIILLHDPASRTNHKLVRTHSAPFRVLG